MPSSCRHRYIGSRVRTGVAVLSTNVAVEYDQHKIQVPGISWHAGRLPLPPPIPQKYADLLPALWRGVRESARNLSNASVNQVMVGLSAETFSPDLGAGETIDELRCELGETELIVGQDAIVRSLEVFDAKTIAVLTPYREEGNELVMRFFDTLGYRVKRLASVPGLSPAEVGDTPKRAVFEAVAAMDDKDIDVIVQMGTGLSISDLIPTLESRLGKPIIASNLAHAWYALRASGVRDRVSDLGVLLAKH